MADIDQILAGGAGAGSRYDFSTIADPVKTFFDANKQRAEFDTRRAFRDGVPVDANGQPDFATMAKVLFQKGDLGQGVAASNLAIQRDQLKLGQDVAAKIGSLEGGGQPAIVSPPSTNRTASTPVAAPLNRGGETQPQAPQPRGGATVMQVVAAQGIPNHQLEAASASIARQLGVDPTAPIDTNDPQVRNVLVPAIQQLKRMGVGEVAQAGQPAVQPIPPVNPQVNQGTFGAPPATPSRGAVPTGTDPEIQKQIATYTSIASNPAYPKSVQEAAMTRLKALQEQGQPTPDIKNYDLYRRQGGTASFQDWQAETELKKAAAGKEAEAGAKKYEALVEAGTKAQMEIPQLELMQQQMDDPNFFSGAGEKYNLLYKRLKSAVGIDPEAAVPQEMLRKVTSANILSGLGALKGLGQIRVAEINLAKDAAASPDNSIPANKFLIETSKRTHQRSAEIAEMAQAYKEEHGTLDAGFDKKVTAYYKANPLYTDAEIKDWHKIIGEAKTQPKSAPAGMQRFASPGDVQAAIASGKLKSGDPFLTSDGRTKYAP